MNPPNNRQIGAVCRALRALHDLTQTEFSGRLGINAQTLRAIEGGYSTRCPEFILPICNASGVTIEEFDRLADLYLAADARLARAHVQR